MNTVKTFRDGSRLIIVVDNCTGELAAKVNRFVLDVLSMPTEPETVPAVIPEPVYDEPAPALETAVAIEEPTEEILFDEPIPVEEARELPLEDSAGTLGNALDNKDTKAIVNFCLRAKRLPDSVSYTAMAMCKEYIRADCQRREPDYTSTREIQIFLDAYKPLIENAIKQILSASGYADLDDFFELTDEYMHQDAYRSILDALLTRVTT